MTHNWSTLGWNHVNGLNVVFSSANKGRTWSWKLLSGNARGYIAIAASDKPLVRSRAEKDAGISVRDAQHRIEYRDVFRGEE